MELREALTQIAEIRQQMARGEIFRGYRSATTAFSGVAAVVTGLLQSVLWPGGGLGSGVSPKGFVMLWSGAAAVCLGAVGVEMIVRTRRSQSPMQRQLTLLAVEQFMPSVAAGALLTFVICDYVRGGIWMLPGLWMILFSLGVFASARLLPRTVFAVGGFYLIAGVMTLALMSDPQMGGGRWGAEGLRFSPWAMGGVFGVGQFAMTGILYWKLEKQHGG